MPAPHVIFPVLEGIVGSLSGATQPVALWVKQMKEIMLCGTNKDQTDWELATSEDVDQSVNVISASAVDVYGVLISTNSADAEADWFVMTDTAAGDFDGTAALDNDDLWVFQIPAAATDGTEEFHPFTFPKGINFPAGLDLGADGRDGTNPAADDIRAWVIYRS
jgi:hypothetical protein